MSLLAQPGRGRGQGGQKKRRDQSPQTQGSGPAATPFVSTLSEVSVAHALQRQIAQIAPQVRGQGGRIGVTLLWVFPQALDDQVFQAWRDQGIVEAPGSGGFRLLSFRSREGPTNSE